MIIKPIKTRKLLPPEDDLFAALRHAVKRVPERSILAITSKIVSIGEGRCVPVESVADKDKLIISEAEYYLPRDEKTPWVMHTMKHNLLIPTAGIDESNANGFYILWPKDPQRSAKRIYDWVKKTYGAKEFGVVITDSHSLPLRRGVMGISLGHCGFAPLKDYRDTQDIFGRVLKVTQTNVADGIAAAAVLAMGEGNEQTPAALATDISFVTFAEKPPRSRKQFSSFEVSPKDDLYAPFFSRIKWRKGRNSENKKI